MMNRIKKYTKWFAISTSVIVALLLISGSAGLLYINSQTGRTQLVTWLNTYFENESQNIKLDAIEGSVFSGFTLTRLTLSDQKGIWLDLQQAKINWSPLSLLGGTLNISSMDVQSAHLHHIPKSRAETETQSPMSLEIPTLPLGINITSFNVATIEFDGDIVKTKAKFRGDGSLKLTEQNGVLLKANMVSLGRSKDQIKVDMAYPGAGRDLTADMLINAPKGGTFGSLVGIDPNYGIIATFRGDGPLKNWAGTLNARVNDTDIADATVKVTGQALSIRAKLDAGEFIPDTGAALFGRTANLAFELKPTASENIKALSLDLVADTMKLHAQGNAATDSFTATQGISFDLEIIDAQPFNRMITPGNFQPFSVKGVISDLSNIPVITANFSSINAAYSSLAGAIVTGQIAAKLDPRDIDIQANGVMSNVAGTVFSNLQPLIEQDFNWAFDGLLNRENFAITLRTFALENRAAQLNLGGEFDSKTNAIQGKLQASLANIGLLTPDISGNAMLEAIFEQESAQAPLKSTINLTSNRINSSIPWLNELVGNSPSLIASVNRSQDGAISISDVDVSAQFFKVNGGMSLSPEQAIERSEFYVKITDLEELETLKGIDVEGSIDVAVNMSGLLASPSIRIETGLRQLDVQGFRLQNPVARLTANNLFTQPNGSIALESNTNIGALTASATFNVNEPSQLKLSEVNVSAGNYSLSGALSAESAAALTGELTLVTLSQKKTDTPYFGNINGQMKFADAAGVQQINISGNLKDLIIPVNGYRDGPVYGNDIITLESGSITTSVTLAETAPIIDGTAELNDFSHPSIQSKSMRLNVQQQKDALAYSIDMQGTQFMPYDLNVSGDLKTVQDEKQISVLLKGSVAGTPLSTVKPMALLLKHNDITLKPFQIQLGDGTIDGSFIAQNDNVTLDMNIDKADLKPLNVFFPDIPAVGVLNGQVTFNAAPAKTSGDFTFALSNISADQGAILLDPALTVSLNGKINEMGISASGAAQLPNVIDADFSVQMPIRFDAMSYSVIFPENEPIAGKLAFKGNIDTIWPVLELVNHDLAGSIDTQFQIGGTLANPDLDGHINLTQGRYENTQTGFVATNIDLKTTITDRHLVVDYLNANDGASGSISADGSLDILPDFSFNAEAKLAVNRARIVRRPTLDVTASSNLTFIKNRTATTLTGDITVDSANVGAVTQGSTDVIELDVREVNGNANNTTQVTAANGAHLGPLSLDLNFRAPGRLFIRSYGLDSEWSSEIKLQGSSQAPIVSGSATLVRGVFDFSGKRFTLTKGNLSFQKDTRNDPLIDITAEYQLPDLTAFLTIGGRASAPTLEMRSTPSLPQDEIISRIFFGTSVAALSPIEAVQLAATVHSLSTGGGPGLIGGVRRSLGIDRLAIDQSDGREFGTTITGGKYLTNNIYVEVSTAPATGETSTAVEVSLTRNLSLITRRTLDNDNNLAIRWSWNY